MLACPVLDFRKRGGKVSMLTNKQHFVLRWVVLYMDKNRRAPSLTEIATVYKREYHLKGNGEVVRGTIGALIHKRCLVRIPGKARGLRVTERGVLELSLSLIHI